MITQEIKAVLKSSNPREYRKFGLTVGSVLILISVFFLWRGNAGFEFVLYVGLGLVILGFILPRLLKPIYILWMSFAVSLGYIMTRVILSLLYAIIFTPTGLFIRLIRIDLLRQKIDPNLKTYWLKRDRKKIDTKSVENQY